MRTSCEQCGKTFSKRTKKELDMAVRMHTGRVHGNIKNRSLNGEGHQTRKELTEEQKEARRQYQRDRRARLKANGQGGRGIGAFQNGHSIEFHYCPRCGQNLDQLAIAWLATLRVGVNKV